MAYRPYLRAAMKVEFFPINSLKVRTMTKYRLLSIVALLSALLLAPRIIAPAMAAEMAGVMMKDGKMMMMKDGKATGPMDHEMTTTNGHKIMPDGTMKMPGGNDMSMQEGQMMTMDGKMMEGGNSMHDGNGGTTDKDMNGMKGM